MTKAVNELGLKWSPPRSHLAAGWTSGFSRGANKPPTNAHPLSSPKYTTSSLNRGTPPTHLASVLLPPLPSPPLTVLKRRDTSACPLWMSPWLRISACPRLSDGRRGRVIRPSRAEPLLHSLDTPTRRLDKRLWRYNLWLSSRSSSLRSSPVRRPVWMQLHSGTWGARQTWPYAPPKPPPRAVNVQPHSGMPPLAHDDGNERGGQVSLSRRSGLVRQPVWTSCGELCVTIHGGSEVVSSDATLPPKTHSSSAASSHPKPAPTQ